MSIKVLISIPMLLIGGTEMQTLNLVKSLVGAGYTVTVCCYYESDPEMVRLLEEAGARVSLMGLDRSNGLWFLAQELVKEFKAISPQIIHVQYVAPGLIPIVATRFAGIRNVIATVHQPASPYGMKARFLLRVGASLCRVFLCVSQAVEKTWFGSSEVFNINSFKQGRTHFTIFNAINAEEIQQSLKLESREKTKLHSGLENKEVVGFVGRLRKEKGLDVLIRAFAILNKTNPNVALVIVGDGPDRKQLYLLAQELGLSDSIHWLGAKAQDEVFSLFSVMDVLTVPSRFEGFGLVAAEAMAAGLPVVASNADGLREVIIDGETGLLFENGNPNDLVDKLLMLLNKPDEIKRMGMTGSTRVKNNFSIEQYSQSIKNLYTAVLST